MAINRMLKYSGAIRKNRLSQNAVHVVGLLRGSTCFRAIACRTIRKPEIRMKRSTARAGQPIVFMGIRYILRLIEQPGEISCVFQFGGFCCAHDSSWWLPQRRRSQQADRVGARWVGGLSRDAPR